MSKIKMSELKLPLILVAEIVLCLAFGDLVPTMIKATLYSISVLLKEILVTLLPFIVFSILFSSLGDLNKGALSFTALAFSMVVLSNYISTSLGGLFGSQFLSHVDIAQHTSHSTSQLIPLWETALSAETLENLTNFWGIKALKFVSNDIGLFAGIICGLLLAFTGNKQARKFSQKLKKYAFAFFRKIFIPFIPLFILGYIMNMQYSGLLESIIEDYITIITFIITVAFIHIVFLYGLATNFKFDKWRKSINNIFPAMITGFSTMSSASSLPVLIDGVAKNTYHESSKGVVPISINIHLVGDCFAISILALSILISFGHPLPTLEEYMLFTIFFVLAKFAVAAVPGGGILVMLPILEKYLGFTPEMLSLITALYILFDPIVTAANVLGNGVFAQLFEKAYNAFYSRKKVASYGKAR